MKKIIIFTCHCGNGHTAAENALKYYLSQDYQVESVCIFCQVLTKTDLVKKITFGAYTLEHFYNFLLRKKWNQLLNILLYFNYYYLKIQYKKINTIIDNYFKTNTPHLVISTIPLVNDHILNNAKKHKIPFILFPTDLNPTIFIRNIKNPDYSEFYITISFNNDAIFHFFDLLKISRKHIIVTGFPLPPLFFSPKNREKIKNEFNISPNKPVVSLLMGSQGIISLYNFARQLAKVKSPFHLIIMRGKNNQIHKKLEKIYFPPHINTTILEFTQRIDDLMSITNLLISKSGGASVSEAIYMNVPMLLDATSSIPTWEQFNQTFVLKNHFGELVKEYETLPNLVDHYLIEKKCLAKIKQNLQAYKKKNGGVEIKKLVDQLLKKELRRG